MFESNKAIKRKLVQIPMHHVADLKIWNNLARFNQYIAHVTAEDIEMSFGFHDFYLNPYKT